MTPILAPVHWVATEHETIGQAAAGFGSAVPSGSFAGQYLSGFIDGLEIAIADPAIAAAVLEAIHAEITTDDRPARDILRRLRAAIREGR